MARQIYRLCFFFFLDFAAAQSLNMPVLIMYRFEIYFAAFLIDYYIFSHEEVLKIIEKVRILMLGLSIIGIVFYLIRYGGINFTDSDCLQSIITNPYLWVLILAIIGCAEIFQLGNRFYQIYNKIKFWNICFALSGFEILCAGNEKIKDD